MFGSTSKFKKTFTFGIAFLAITLSELVLVQHPVFAAQINIINRNYPGVQWMRGYFNSIRVGNQGRSQIHTLTVDTNTGIISGTGNIIASHSWGSVNIQDGVETYSCDNCTGSGIFRVCVPVTCTRPRYRQVEVAASRSIPFRFSYDMTTRDLRGNARIPIGLTTTVAGRTYRLTDDYVLDFARLERALDGDLVAIAESVPSSAWNSNLYRVHTRDEYEYIRNSYYQTYGTNNVYFASRRFTDWAKPETLAEYGAQAIISGGGATPAIMQRIQSQSLKELSDLTTWLQSKIGVEAQSVAYNLLSGRYFDYPYLAFGWQTVGYYSRRTLFNSIATPEVRSTHGAFVVVWRGNFRTEKLSPIDSLFPIDSFLSCFSPWYQYGRGTNVDWYDESVLLDSETFWLSLE